MICGAIEYIIENTSYIHLSYAQICLMEHCKEITGDYIILY